MELFEEIFNKESIYDMLFLNVKAVLEHPTLADLQEKNPALCKRWKHLSETKYNQKIYEIKSIPQIIDSEEDELQLIQNNVYEEKAILHPEFSRIVAITYAKLYPENGKVKRYFKKIVGEDEYVVIANFMDVLRELSLNAVNSAPQYFPTFCGHNIINYDIPLLLKRYILHREKFENKLLPLILKRALTAKPWDSVIIDTINVWKLGGNDYASLMLIADYLGLKKTVDLNTLSDVSKHYWELVGEKSEEALEYVALQSATQTNLVIQLMNELRPL